MYQMYLLFEGMRGKMGVDDKMQNPCETLRISELMKGQAQKELQMGAAQASIGRSLEQRRQEGGSGGRVNGNQRGRAVGGGGQESNFINDMESAAGEPPNSPGSWHDPTSPVEHIEVVEENEMEEQEKVNAIEETESPYMLACKAKWKRNEDKMRELGLYQDPPLTKKKKERKKKENTIPSVPSRISPRHAAAGVNTSGAVSEQSRGLSNEDSSWDNNNPGDELQGTVTWVSKKSNLCVYKMAQGTNSSMYT
jgi:hypothetical protein